MKIYSGTTEILDIQVDDNSYRYRAIKGDHNLTLYFSLAEHVEIPLGATCEFQAEIYTLMSPENLKMQHTRNFEYTVVFEGTSANLRKYTFRELFYDTLTLAWGGSKRLSFEYTATPHEHIQMLVNNLNKREEGWSVGECIESPEKLVAYHYISCAEALSQIADTFETEWEIVGKTIHLRKVEYNRNNPLALAYGKGNGFKPGIGRSNYDGSAPLEILYTQGGDRNIDPSTYGNDVLLLPKSQTINYDGQYFEGEEGYDSTKAATYRTDAEGWSVQRADLPLKTMQDGSLDCSEIYPSRVGTVTGVESEEGIGDDGNPTTFYNIIDTTIPEALDYGQCRIAGEIMTIVFQSGRLAGREFDIVQTDSALTGYNHARRCFELRQAAYDGRIMPGDTFIPAVGDKYAVFHCALPQAYIADHTTMTGAEWDMFRQAVKYLYDNSQPKFTFTGELDGIWAKQDWVNIGGRIKLGGYVQFTDARFQPDPVLIRITGIKDYINNPYSPEIELSNAPVSSGVTTTIGRLEGNEVVNDNRYKDSLQFTRRRFRDAQQTAQMLESALLDGFAGSISPITAQTMQLLVGSEALQFRFVSNTTDPETVSHTVSYDSETKKLYAEGGIIQHMTLGITSIISISSSHAASDYKFWTLSPFESAVLDDPGKSFYFYAKVSKTDQTGTFLLSETAIAMEGITGYYHLLMGVLNSEIGGERSYESLYGYTEILPGSIRTDRIASSNGETYFDLANNKIAGYIEFLNGLISGEVLVGTEGNSSAGLSGLEGGKGDIRFWIGEQKENRDNAPFRVAYDGKFFSSDAHITGIINALGGIFRGDVLIKDPNGSDNDVVKIQNSNISSIDSIRGTGQIIEKQTISTESRGTKVLVSGSTFEIENDSTAITIDQGSGDNAFFALANSGGPGSPGQIGIAADLWLESSDGSFKQRLATLTTYAPTYEGTQVATTSSPVNHTLTLNAGTYALYISSSITNNNPTQGFAYAQLGSVSISGRFDASFQRTEIGRNGMAVIMGSSAYVWFGYKPDNTTQMEMRGEITIVSPNGLKAWRHTNDGEQIGTRNSENVDFSWTTIH